MAKANDLLLYVEDEETDRFLMQMAFANEGEDTLYMVKDGKAALDYLAGSAPFADRGTYPLPKLVLLDLNLPEVPGFDVLTWIREHPVHSQLPVIVFTSSDRGEDRERARLLGANEFLLKPNSLPRLREVVRRLTDQYLRGFPSRSGLSGSSTRVPEQ
jgi:CheY-like chemotaxis protein